MALKLNAWVARGLHGKKREYPNGVDMYGEDANPLLGFMNHFRDSRLFTADMIGLQLWEELKPIVDDPEMPQNPHNFW